MRSWLWALIAKQIGFYSDSSFLCLCFIWYSLGFLLVVLEFWVSLWSPWSTWSWFLYKVSDKTLISFFYLRPFSFPSTVYWRCWLPSSMYFWHLHWISGGCNCLGLSAGLSFSSTGPHFSLFQDRAIFATMALYITWHPVW